MEPRLEGQLQLEDAELMLEDVMKSVHSSTSIHIVQLPWTGQCLQLIASQGFRGEANGQSGSPSFTPSHEAAPPPRLHLLTLKRLTKFYSGIGRLRSEEQIVSGAPSLQLTSACFSNQFQGHLLHRLIRPFLFGRLLRMTSVAQSVSSVSSSERRS